MREELRRYVAGFLFREDEVLLVCKTHPKWQAGLLNAIGGEIEGFESAMEAMVREFTEEVHYQTNAWEMFAVEYGPGYEVTFFRHTLSPDFEKKSPFVPPDENDRGEELMWVRCSKYDMISNSVVGNLRWLLPLALDPRQINCIIRTTGDIRKLKTW
jgi:8-oxo-dGTP pyrophosphatase MutT (NUDIX family)